ncbi:4606_t:CDS:2 [Dentiscutata erythropus]|uniref:4606_t:CDS:1 n=1 Tax=Dentiscutata erythropus TaxID=1348616 RepID=A0A9N9D334_9GLOM|nr:4606_t:CDS:2 [Dentiscutata erythropus]
MLPVNFDVVEGETNLECVYVKERIRKKSPHKNGKDPEVKKEYQQQAETLKKDQQKQNNSKYKYKKRLYNEITTGSSKKRRISDNEELLKNIDSCFKQ